MFWRVTSRVTTPVLGRILYIYSFFIVYPYENPYLVVREKFRPLRGAIVTSITFTKKFPNPPFLLHFWTDHTRLRRRMEAPKAQIDKLKKL